MVCSPANMQSSEEGLEQRCPLAQQAAAGSESALLPVLMHMRSSYGDTLRTIRTGPQERHVLDQS